MRTRSHTQRTLNALCDIVQFERRREKWSYPMPIGMAVTCSVVIEAFKQPGSKVSQNSVKPPDLRCQWMHSDTQGRRLLELKPGGHEEPQSGHWNKAEQEAKHGHLNLCSHGHEEESVSSSGSCCSCSAT